MGFGLFLAGKAEYVRDPEFEALVCLVAKWKALIFFAIFFSMKKNVKLGETCVLEFTGSDNFSL